MPHPRIQPASLKTILSDDALPSLPADRASYTGHRARVVVRRASRARAQWTDHIVRALIVNVVERFSIAAFMHAALALSLSATARSAITIGFIGGLTTYSSFNYETSRLFEEGAIGAAVLNATATIFGAFAAGWGCCPRGYCLTGEGEAMRVVGRTLRQRELIRYTSRSSNTRLTVPQ